MPDKETRDLIDKVEVRIGATLKAMWDKIDNIQNRLPVWATIVIAILVGFIGWQAK